MTTQEGPLYKVMQSPAGTALSTYRTDAKNATRQTVLTPAEYLALGGMMIRQVDAPWMSVQFPVHLSSAFTNRRCQDVFCAVEEVQMMALSWGVGKDFSKAIDAAVPANNLSLPGTSDFATGPTSGHITIRRTLNIYRIFSPWALMQNDANTDLTKASPHRSSSDDGYFVIPYPTGWTYDTSMYHSGIYEPVGFFQNDQSTTMVNGNAVPGGITLQHPVQLLPNGVRLWLPCYSGVSQDPDYSLMTPYRNLDSYLASCSSVVGYFTS
jgi:hypothetical protein